MFDTRLEQLRNIPTERVAAFDIFLHRYAVQGGGLLGVNEAGHLLGVSERDAILALMDCVRLSVLMLTNEGGRLYFHVPAYKPDTVTARDVFLAYRDLSKSYE